MTERESQAHAQNVLPSRVEGDEIIEVVRDTVQQLELLTERLRTFMDHPEEDL